MFGFAQPHWHGITDPAERGRFLAALMTAAATGAFHSFARRIDCYPSGASVQLVCGHRQILANQDVRVWQNRRGWWAEQVMPLDAPGEDRVIEVDGLRRLTGGEPCPS